MSFDPRDPIFEKLLDLNPWARELWDERLDLIAAESWNISYRNQGGNPDTMAWLRRFLPARSDATLDRLGSGDHSAWHRGIFEAIVPLFDDPTFATAYIGTPMKPTQGGALINTDTRVAGYSVGQFKADVLLLAQASLYEVSLDTPLDLSRLSFVIGPYIYASRFAAIAAHETRFGPFGDFVSCRFGLFDAAGAEFFDQIGFTPSTFAGDAIFAGAEFHGGASFQGVSFDGAADFTEAMFGDWTAFAGSVFAQMAVFSNASFKGDTTFEHVTFKASADFTGARFEAGVGVSGIEDRAVVRMIEAAR